CAFPRTHPVCDRCCPVRARGALAERTATSVGGRSRETANTRRGREAEEPIDGEPCGAIKPAQLQSQALAGPRNGRSRVKIDDVSCGMRASKFKALSYRRYAATCSC